MRNFSLRALVFFCAAACVQPASAQQAAGLYPVKPVMVVVANVAGGTTDTETRMYAQKLGESLGKPFLIDYRPGAGGAIGAAFVAKAAPDGYTLLVASTSFPVVPALNDELLYDPVKDFAPLSLMSKRPAVLLVHPDFPARSLKEYLAYARANPRAINFGTSGSGGVQHLAGAWLHSASATQVTFIHYKGAAAVIPDLLSGRLHAFPTALITAMPHIRAGKLRAISILSMERSFLLPELKTASEEAVDGFDMPSWVGLVATGGTPLPIVNRLGNELAKIAKAPDVAKKMEEGTVMVGSDPAQFARLIGTEVARWRQLVKEHGIKQD